MSTFIDWVRDRSIEVGDCWEWQGYFTPHGRTPVSTRNSKNISVRRVLAIELQLIDDRSRKVTGTRCRNWRCVNPKHLQLLTRQVAAKRAAENRTGGKLIASRKASDQRRKRAKLSIDQVRAIRASDSSCRLLGIAYGVSPNTISLIKSGRIWRETGNVFSNLVESVL
ncbi:MAG: hypothetical protein EB116_20115 [Betaproteobacteria bacterium]|nr:hypothetical protein [Betaproteobacteria bacterium]